MRVQLAIDAVIGLHLLFIAVVVFGALPVLRWPRLAWVQGPVFLWGAAVNLAGWPCPLTTLENELRARGGLPTYRGAFVTHYLLPVNGPWVAGFPVEKAVGVFVVVVNALVYALLAWRWWRGRSSPA